MQLNKAIRHIVLAEASRAARALLNAGHAESAAEVERTADGLRFDAIDRKSLVTGAGEEESVEKMVNIWVIEAGEVKLQRRVPISRFSLYDRKASGLLDAGQDFVQAHNAAEARALFAEFHEARLGRALDAATATVLAGQGMPSLVAAQASISPWVWIGLGALALIALGCSIVHALVVFVVFWACQAVDSSPRTNAVFALIPAVTGVAFVGQPSSSYDAVLAATLTIGALLRSENAKGVVAWCWSITAGVAAGAALLSNFDVGAPFLVSLIVVLVVGKFLFIRYPWPASIGLVVGIAVMFGVSTWWPLSHDTVRPMIERTTGLPWSTRFNIMTNYIPLLVQHYHYSNWCWIAFLLPLWGFVVFGWISGIYRRPVSMLLPVVLFVTCLGAMQAKGFGGTQGLGALVALTLAVASRAGAKIYGLRAVVVLVGFSVLFTVVSVLGVCVN